MSDDLLRDLRAALPSLRPSERRVAELVLADPVAAVDLTINDLAERGDTSVASVVRFCRTLGYSGYSDFRLTLASSVGREQVSLGRFGVSDSDISETDDAESVVAKLAFHEAHDIEATAAGLDLRVLDIVAAAVVAAPRIDIYGSASSGLTAADLQQKLHRVGLVSYHWTDVHLALTSAAVLTKGCVAIGFSHSGRTIETADSLASARERGATTVLVTNFPASPIAQEVDYVLATSATETRYRPGAMSGRIAQLAVVDFLFVRIAQLMSDRASAPLELSFDAVQSHRLKNGRRSR
jgi:DNA-binding MurR/RpiR family transcriptional regulator